MGLWQWIAAPGGYDAIVDRKRRRAPKTVSYAEDQHAGPKERQALVATARDVVRNFAVARWAVGKHLDYVSSFSFQSTTGDPALDRDVEAFVGSWSTRHRCDIARRHPLRRMIRLAEARKCVDGDVLFLKIAGAPESPMRGKLQVVESDRIATPEDLPKPWKKEEFTNGVQLLAGGAASGYCICDRGERGRKVFSRVVKGDNAVLHAWWDRFDQVRGISPITSALNSFQDVYEGFDYALAKLKVAQLFGLAMYRSGTSAIGAETDEDADGQADSVDFGRGPFVLELDSEDRAEFLEASTPATETTEYLKLIIHVALKALNIPYSFFDESFTNFYGSRGGLIQYLKSCKTSIEDLRDVLDELTRWRLTMAIADGDLTADPETLVWEWIPDGVPWWDPVKEVTGHTRAIAAGLSDFQSVCRAAGSDFFENVDRIAAQQAYATERGVTLNLGMQNQQMAPIVAGEQEDDEDDDQPNSED